MRTQSSFVITSDGSKTPSDQTPNTMKHNLTMLKIKDLHGYSYSDFSGFNLELNKRGFDHKSLEVFLGNLSVGKMLECADGKYITTWGAAKYKTQSSALTYLIKLLNGL